MSIYHKIIIGATGCAPEDAPQIEEIMRDDIFHGTLDWQSKGMLCKAAQTAYRFIQAERKTAPAVTQQ